jgi:geranylgeranyl reductase family protein
MAITRKSCDVFVVGLGPGGASAARIASENGLRVIGIDKKKVFGSPVQCAEFIPMPMNSYAADEPVRVQTITQMKSFLPSGAAEISDFPGLMIDRQQFDEHLVEQAQKSGAEVHASAQLIALDHDKNVALFALGSESYEINYATLVAADGPHSPVAKLLGLPPLSTVNTRQYTVPLLVEYHDTDIWLSNDYAGGYAWLFPKGRVANLGLGADKRFAADLKTPLDKLHQQLIDEGLLGREIFYRTGGAIPVSGLRNKIVHDNILFVGDAAGLTHPITGAGISSAVLSGERAGEAVTEWLAGDEDALQDFEDDIRDQFEVTLNRAVAKRSWLKQHWDTQAANDDAVMRGGWIAFDEYFVAARD